MSQKGIINIVILLILVVAIGVGLYLVSKPQIFRSRASSNPNDWLQNFTFKDTAGNTIECDTSQNPPVCTTASDQISVTVNPDLFNAPQP